MSLNYVISIPSNFNTLSVTSAPSPFQNNFTTPSATTALPSLASSISSLNFTAAWQENNRHLSRTFFEKVKLIMTIFWNAIITVNLLPASTFDDASVKAINLDFQRKWNTDSPDHQMLRKNFTPTPIEVTTPDGIKLSGTYFKNASAQETSPTVICFQPNAALSKQGVFDWLLKQAALQEFPYNFVYFDYRGCGESNSIACSQKDLFLDGESIYQFVRDKLRVPENDIHFYGWSLGGGVSSNVKALHPECRGNYVNERSFNRIGNVLTNIIPSLSSVASWILSALNWNIDAAAAFEKLKGKTLVVRHPEDEMMRGRADLYQSLIQRQLAPSTAITDLDLSLSPTRANSFHCNPLGTFAVEDFNPEHAVSQFLFDSNTSFSARILERFARGARADFRNAVFERIAREYQNGGRYWGSAEDAFYNRNGQTMTDAQRVEAIVTAKLQGL